MHCGHGGPCRPEASCVRRERPSSTAYGHAVYQASGVCGGNAAIASIHRRGMSSPALRQPGGARNGMLFKRAARRHFTALCLQRRRHCLPVRGVEGKAAAFIASAVIFNGSTSVCSAPAMTIGVNNRVSIYAARKKMVVSVKNYARLIYTCEEKWPSRQMSSAASAGYGIEK